MKGQNSQTSTTAKRRKKKLPGPSATQKSVADFFKKQNKLEVVGLGSNGPIGTSNSSKYVTENHENISPGVMCEMSVSVQSSSTNDSDTLVINQGGEDTDSFENLIEGGRGEGRPENDNKSFMSPSTRKLIQKSRSVAEIRKSFLKENCGSKKLENVAHTVSSNHSQSWRFKLLQFKSNNPDNGQ